MRMTTTRRIGAAALALSLVAAACGGDDDDSSASGGEGGGTGPGGYVWDGTVDAGITDDTLLIGSSGPLSGPASAYSPITQGVGVCADYINGEFGGVTMLDGKTRQIEVEILDDGYSPEQTVENIRRLHEQVGVFATVNVLGTPTNTAIVDIVEDNEVPNILVATGATRWGRDFASGDYAYTMGWQPAYQTEGKIYAAYIAENFPGSTVAILQQNDDYGDDYVSGFEQGIEGTDIEIIAVETYASGDPDVSQQMISLADSGADIFFNVTTPKYAAQAMVSIGSLDWDPIQFLNSVSNSTGTVLIPAAEGGGTVEGVYTAKWAADPTDPALADDPAMIEYRDMWAKYSDLNTDDAFAFFAWNSCLAQKEIFNNIYPTRASLLATVGNMDEINIDVPLVYADKVSTSIGTGDGWPLEAMQVEQYNGGVWEKQGAVVDVDM